MEGWMPVSCAHTSLSRPGNAVEPGRSWWAASRKATARCPETRCPVASLALQQNQPVPRNANPRNDFDWRSTKSMEPPDATPSYGHDIAFGWKSRATLNAEVQSAPRAPVVRSLGGVYRFNKGH